MLWICGIRNGGQLILATSPQARDIEHPRGAHGEKKAHPGDYLGRHQIYRRPGEGANVSRL